MDDDFKKLLWNIPGDIRVELGDEFDRNFERQAFFSRAWQRRRSPGKAGRATLAGSGSLRRSIKSRIDPSGAITFYSELPYAAIHNEGGEIRVTERMKRYFWRRYYETTGVFGRRKDGTVRRDKRNVRLDTEADFWKAMALMKSGSVIRIPRRQFIGYSPEVEKAVREIIEENLDEYFKNLKI